MTVGFQTISTSFLRILLVVVDECNLVETIMYQCGYSKMTAPVKIGQTLYQPFVRVTMTVLRLRGWESLKILDGPKVQDIDNIQSHNADCSDWAKYSFTLESDTICKPIQWEFSSLSDPTALSMFVTFVTFFRTRCPYLLRKYINIVSHVVTVSHAVTVSHGGDHFTLRWLFYVEGTVLHGCLARGNDRFSHGYLVPNSDCTWNIGVSVF